MTTIAFDGCTMASDSAFNGENMRDMLINDTKVRTGKDFLLGIAGDFGSFKYFENFIMKEAWDEVGFLDFNEYAFHAREVLDAEGIDLILASIDGVFEWHHPGIFLPTSHQPYAIGTGAAYAIGAMFQGATAKEAVRTAHNFDKDTNDTIYVAMAPWLTKEQRRESDHPDVVPF